MGSDFEVIQGPYFSYLMHQPEALRATWNGLRETDVFPEIAGVCGERRFERVVLTGMGSSYFGLHPLSIELAAHGWTPLMLETSELIHYYAHLLAPSTLVIAVSQSGRSAETVRLLDMNAHRAPVIGVTNWPDSPLAQQADYAVLTAAGSEYTVSCKTYVSAQMALRLLAAALCSGNLAVRLSEMQNAADLVEQCLANWKSHVAELIEILSGIRDIFLVGRGPSLAAAQTGGLILKESAHFHSEGMSSAAFRHGPFEMLHSGIFVAVFGGAQQTRTLSEALVLDVQQTPAKVALISEDANPGWCKLPSIPELLRPIVEILPVEMMTLALAALAHREAGKFERATKITAVE